MDVGVVTVTVEPASSSSWGMGLVGVGCASRDSAGGIVAGEDEETDGDEVADEGDEVADEGVAVEPPVEEGAIRTWQEDVLGVLVADDVCGVLLMTLVMLSATAGGAGGARAALSVDAGDVEA